MVCSPFGGRTRIVLLLLSAAVLPSCGGGSPSDGPSALRVNSNPSVSRDARLVMFESSSSAGRQVVVIDRLNATSEVVAASDDLSNAVVTPDGRFVAFDARPAGSAARQVFVQERATGITTPVSTTPDGVPGDGDSTTPSISDDGRFVAFQSQALNLGARSASSNSVLLRDVSAGTTQLASADSSSDDVNAAVSGNGQFVAFESRPLTGTGPSSVLLFNGRSGQVSPVSQTAGAPALNGPSAAPSVDFDGRLVAFESRATNLTPASPDTSGLRGESNIVVRDVLTGALAVATVPIAPSVAADGDSHHPVISSDGRSVAFDSTATNLTADAVVPGESNIFVRDLSSRSTELITPADVQPTTETPPPTTATPGGAEVGLSTGTPVQPIAPTSGLSTGTPVQPIAPAGGLSTGTPVQPLAPSSGLSTSTPVQPIAPVGGLSTSTPVQPIAPVSGLSTGTPVQPTAPGSSLVTGTPVQPIAPSSGLSTSTPVQPIAPSGGLSTSTPVQPIAPVGSAGSLVGAGAGVIIVAMAAEMPSGGARPRFSSDGAWVVFESKGRIFLAERGTRRISEIRGTSR